MIYYDKMCTCYTLICKDCSSVKMETNKIKKANSTVLDYMFACVLFFKYDSEIDLEIKIL